MLSMRGCSSIQDNALGYLCRKLKRLEVLDLWETLPDGWSLLAHAQDLRLLQHEYHLNGLSRLFRDGNYDYTDPLQKRTCPIRTRTSSSFDNVPLTQRLPLSCETGIISN